MVKKEVTSVPQPKKVNNLHEKIVHFIDNFGSNVKGKMSFNFAA
jgi:NTE family protein